MDIKTINITNERETEAFGLKIGHEIAPGTVIALIGDLGTGKTTLTKSIAAGLGITETITSPTFNIIKEYTGGRIPMYHFDVYRIASSDEMFELGYEEYFYGDGVCVIEWADIIEDILPEDAIVIRIKYGYAEGQRVYEITNNTKAQGKYGSEHMGNRSR